MGRFLLLLAVLCLKCLTASAQSGVAEQYFFAAINAERATHNLPPVRLDTALHGAALSHARQMVEHGIISHQFAGESELSARASKAGARFSRVTENVAEGPNAVTLHTAWMRSPGHRANILDSAVDAVGIAVLLRGRQLFAVEDFERTVEDLKLDQQEAAVAVLLDRSGLELIPDGSARATCAAASGYPGEEQPTFILRYTTGDLSQLPSQLKQRIATRQEHGAAVGACAARTGSPFTDYSIAVLLYP